VKKKQGGKKAKQVMGWWVRSIKGWEDEEIFWKGAWAEGQEGGGRGWTLIAWAKEERLKKIFRSSNKPLLLLAGKATFF